MPSILRDYEAVHEAVSRSTSLTQALQLLGLRAAGGNFRALHEACGRFDLEPPVCTSWQPPPSEATSDDLVFCENSSYMNRNQIKARLLRSGVPNKCAACGLGPRWNGRPLVLQLEHVNGVFNDNRIGNLALLCPNCHSQTETFTGRNRTATKVPCKHCSHLIHPTAQRCAVCRRWQVKRTGRPKIDWPETQELRRMVASSSFSAVARTLGVSDTAVHKRLRRPAC
jgi:hypothetical protein